MGLHPGDSTDKMPDDDRFKEQCRAFLARQIQIVDPKLIVALGRDVGDELLRVEPALSRLVQVRSPSSREALRESSADRKRIAERYESVS